MGKVDDLKGLLIDAVQDLYENEVATVAGLPAIIAAVASPALRDALTDHRTASEEQARRLTRIAEALGTEAKGPTCLWAEGILHDARRDTQSVATGPLLDIALIGAVRKLEAAEIVSYETAIGIARVIDLPAVEGDLTTTHREEVTMDATLQRLLLATVDAAA